MTTKRTVRIMLCFLLPLVVPAIGIHTVQGWNWTGFDFLVAGAILALAGLAYAFISSRRGDAPYRTGVAVAVGGSLFLVWVNLAVGIIGDDNPANLTYLLVPVLGVVGICAARFQPRGMMWTAFAMAALTGLAPAIAYVADLRPFDPGIGKVTILSLFFASIFATSALFFKGSAAQNG